MKYIVSIILLGCFLLKGQVLCQTNTSRISDWELAKEKDGVRVYTRYEEGTEVKAFRAIVTVKSDMKSIERLLDNLNNYPSWQTSVTGCTLLKWINSTTRISRYYTDLPYPLTDRDIIIKSTKNAISNGTVTYKLTCVPDFAEEKENCIRVKMGYGMWQLTPQPGGEIQVLYQFLGDPGGRVPGWVVNLFLVDGPCQTMINLRELVEEN